MGKAASVMQDQETMLVLRYFIYSKPALGFEESGYFNPELNLVLCSSYLVLLPSSFIPHPSLFSNLKSKI
ncbi:hypothetical protein [Aquiflexum lacus]|uniref:hypothetical protein n=1 Tax=Aquiflexum lacus TaxID=2483805 RepID=UPI001895C922|nr:hypothetical protein [Aquiflexum lacus]